MIAQFVFHFCDSGSCVRMYKVLIQLTGVRSTPPKAQCVYVHSLPENVQFKLGQLATTKMKDGGRLLPPAMDAEGQERWGGREEEEVCTSVNEVPKAWMHLQPLAVGAEEAGVAWGLAHSLVGAGAALRGLEGAVGQFPLLPFFIMVPAGQAPWRPPVGVGVDPVALSCNTHTCTDSCQSRLWTEGAKATVNGCEQLCRFLPDYRIVMPKHMATGGFLVHDMTQKDSISQGQGCRPQSPGGPCAESVACFMFVC